MLPILPVTALQFRRPTEVSQFQTGGGHCQHDSLGVIMRAVNMTGCIISVYYASQRHPVLHDTLLSVDFAE